MNQLDAQLRAVLTANHDEGIAHFRDLIPRIGEETWLEWIWGLVESQYKYHAGDNRVEYLIASCALLGAIEAWIALCDQRASAEAEA